MQGWNCVICHSSDTLFYYFSTLLNSISCFELCCNLFRFIVFCSPLWGGTVHHTTVLQGEDMRDEKEAHPEGDMVGMGDARNRIMEAFWSGIFLWIAGNFLIPALGFCIIVSFYNFSSFLTWEDLLLKSLLLLQTRGSSCSIWKIWTSEGCISSKGLLHRVCLSLHKYCSSS